MNNPNLLPKKARGSVHIEFKKCGKPGCRCAKGALHGPYLSIHHRIAGRQYKRYLRVADLGNALADCESRRMSTSALRTIRRDLKEIADAYS